MYPTLVVYRNYKNIVNQLCSDYGESLAPTLFQQGLATLMHFLTTWSKQHLIDKAFSGPN